MRRLGDMVAPSDMMTGGGGDQGRTGSGWISRVADHGPMRKIRLMLLCAVSGRGIFKPHLGIGKSYQMDRPIVGKRFGEIALDCRRRG